MNIRLRGGRVVDPSQRMDQISDVFIQNGVIFSIRPPESESPIPIDRTIDVQGAVVAPGFVDLHTHLRDPGQTNKEDLATGTYAAAAGGFASVFCMPNTEPVNDSIEVTRFILDRAKKVGRCRVYPVGAVTLGLKGEELAPLEELKKAGCLAFSDDGRPVNDAKLLREALEIVRRLNGCLIEHCEELPLSQEPKIHDGEIAKKLKLRGIPRSAEIVDAARTMVLASEIGARVHLAHVSCLETVEMIRLFKRQNHVLTAETTPHHLLWTDEAIAKHGTNAKMYPPLREKKDRDALQKAIADGTMDAIATDHAPHTEEEKRREFPNAPNGVIGLETALPVLLTLVSKKGINLSELIALLSTNPAKIMGLHAGSLKKGSAADLVVFEPNEERILTESDLKSKSKNSPFLGFRAKGRVLYTFVDGKEMYPEFEK